MNQTEFASASQVSVEYDSNYQPKRIDSIVLSTQHSNDLNLENLRELVKTEIIDTCLPETLLDSKTKYFINPTSFKCCPMNCFMTICNRKSINCRIYEKK